MRDIQESMKVKLELVEKAKKRGKSLLIIQFVVGMFFNARQGEEESRCQRL